MKRLLMSLLVAVMVAGVAGTAFAATGAIAPKAFSDIAGDKAEAELTLLAAMGVYSGEQGLGGPVKPADPITRAQFCKVVVVAMGRGSTAQGLMGLKPSFRDEIPSWAWGYVNVATYMGVIKGYEDGTFRPDRSVSYAEAVTMLIRAVSGHAAQVGPGTWPYNYVFYGVDNGFSGSVDVGFANLPATRGDMARMLLATMGIDKLDAKGAKLDGTSVLAGRTAEGVVSTYDADSITIGGHDLPLADKVYLIGASSYEGLRNLNVWAVLDKVGGKVMFIQVKGSANVVTGAFKSANTDPDRDGKNEIVLKDGTAVNYNNSDTDIATLNGLAGVDLSKLLAGDEVAITVDKDGQAANVVATRFAAASWIKSNVTKSDAAKKIDTSFTLYGNDSVTLKDTAAVTINGAASNRDALAKYDVLSIAYKAKTTDDLSANAFSGDAYIVRATRQAVEGTVKSVTTSYPNEVHRVTIAKANGSTETYVVSHNGGIGASGSGYSMPSVDAKVKYGLNAAGEIFVPIGYETVTPYVLVLGYEIDGAGHKSVTVDVRGQSVTYKADGFDFSTGIGKYYKLGIDTSDNSLDSATEITVSGDYEVVALDAARGTMTLKSGSSYYFISNKDATVYGFNADGDKVYIGFAGLEVGDHVKANATDATGAVFELIAQ